MQKKRRKKLLIAEARYSDRQSKFAQHTKETHKKKGKGADLPLWRKESRNASRHFGHIRADFSSLERA